jgi:hypothetical protein
VGFFFQNPSAQKNYVKTIIFRECGKKVSFYYWRIIKNTSSVMRDDVIAPLPAFRIPENNTSEVVLS